MEDKNMKTRCVIVCAYNEGSIREAIEIRGDDFVLCADGGYLLAERGGIVPDLLIGDLDSMGERREFACPIVQMPAEKDDTDTMLCIKYAIEKGFGDIVIVGGIGGRLDQTIANIQGLSYALDRGVRIRLCDHKNEAFMLENEALFIEKKAGCKLSIFAYSKTCTGVFERFVKYPLENHTLSSSFPLGVSNEFDGERAQIGVSCGRLLVILSRD